MPLRSLTATAEPRIEVREEKALTSEERDGIRDLLVEAFGAEKLGSSDEAWTQIKPMFRHLALTGGRVVGHQAVVKLRDSSPSIYGLSDLVVVPNSRKVGVGRKLIEEAVEEAWCRGADVLLTATSVPSVVRVFRSLGFHSTARFRYFIELDGACKWNPDWIEQWRTPSSNMQQPLRLPSDF